MKNQRFHRFLPAVVLLALAVLFFLSVNGAAEGRGACNETGDHEEANWIRVHATPADPMPEDVYEVIVTVEVFENGSWVKRENGTVAELVLKPESVNPLVIDRQNGTTEGIRLHTDNTGTYRVWGGVCQGNQSHWNHVNVTIERRNHAPIPIALLGAENGTHWSTELDILIDPGEEFILFLNGSLSSDPEDDDLEFYWDIDGKDPTNDLIGPWGNWTFLYAGTYPIMLTVGDGYLSRVSTVYLHIEYDYHPDLVVSTSPFLSKFEFLAGEDINVTARIQNQGEIPSGPFSIYAYDHDLDSGKNFTIFIEEVDGLDVNEFHTMSFIWTTTERAEPGTHIARVLVDALDAVEEINETNNAALGIPFTVTSPVIEQPFVTIKSMSISNETPFLFELVNISLVIGNSGSGPAKLLTIRLLVNGVEDDIRYIPVLPASSEEELLLHYYADLKGSYNLTCEVYDNNFLQGSQGRRIVIQDLPRPPWTDFNETNTPDDESNLDWLMMGAGVFMIVMAIAIQLVERKARDE
jgi:hypothetical protein